MDDDERGTSTFTASPPGVDHDNDEDDDEEMLQDEFTTTTKNAIEIETDERRIAALKAPSIVKAEHEHEQENQVQRGQGGEYQETKTPETKPRPPKPRPLQSMGPIGTDTQSWIRPTSSGQEAPNGRSVL